VAAVRRGPTLVHRLLRIRTLLLLVTAAALAPTAAEAQIYAWRDANGTLVLSDRQIDAPTTVYAVEGAPKYRTTKAVSPAAARYDDIVQEYSSRESVRPELVRAVIQVESAYNERATSPKGAMGLMQLMPGTAAELGVLDPYDPAQNIRGGTRYLRRLLDKYDGDERLALAAYNAGSGAVDRYGKNVPPYRETQDYVKKVRAAASGTSGVRKAPARVVIYKWIEIIDGRAVPKFSQTPPASGTFDVL
jgi:soluble lytic murein transglycosylase-like protein